MSQTGSNIGSNVGRRANQGTRGLRAKHAASLATCLLLLGTGIASAEELRVATSGDYAPFSLLDEAREAPVFAGFDPAVARAYTADRGQSAVSSG